jgi:chromosomal replication initiation ATPase DnaA
VYKQLPLAISPDSSATFDNFYISSTNNRVVVSALKAFTDQHEEFLFYLSGDVGSGVTHLLEAVQNAAQ